MSSNKTLKTIQTLCKIGKILSKIAFVCSIVGTVGCAVGIAALSLGLTENITVGNLTIHSMIEKNAEMSVGTMYADMIVGGILCLGEVFLSRISANYFSHELKAGTPFTMAGAREMMRLGICTICIPVGTMIAADIAYETINHTFAAVADMHIDDYASVGLGVMFIVMSLLCKLGAQQSAEEK